LLGPADQPPLALLPGLLPVFIKFLRGTASEVDGKPAFPEVGIFHFPNPHKGIEIEGKAV
jgi:hypothetical protein